MYVGSVEVDAVIGTGEPDLPQQGVASEPRLNPGDDGNGGANSLTLGAPFPRPQVLINVPGASAITRGRAAQQARTSFTQPNRGKPAPSHEVTASGHRRLKTFG